LQANQRRWSESEALCRGYNIDLDSEADVKANIPRLSHLQPRSIFLTLGLDVVAMASAFNPKAETKSLISRPSQGQSFSFQVRGQEVEAEAHAEAEGQKFGIETRWDQNVGLGTKWGQNLASKQRLECQNFGL